ncbi:hypothetical protein COY28_04790 [Candidatus Woesearchaeota archaeon CG_4_10_14_0_2_um_filter_57_5]|nr:MAG: hypothetical protein AUJ68_02265 [Candidatus Woesearchaeota archaeon CG1_02_57_44]PIZ51830.1 MAG: hypothetical protein COY28_04790 [Candidatus Woesearchaeota archaeon CG_4_10_14_0_2_um_filter_57_5]
MVYNFSDFFQFLDRIGVLYVLVPFFLIFTIVFAILQKTNILGEHKKNLNVILSLILALAVVIPHVTGAYPPGGDVVNIINGALPGVSLVLVLIICTLLLLGIFGIDLKWMPFPGGILSLVAALVVIAIFGYSAGWWWGGGLPSTLSWLDDPDVQALVLIILVFAIVIGYITREPGDKEAAKTQKNFMESFGRMFGGGEK